VSRILGISTTTSTVFLAVVEDGNVIEIEPMKLAAPAPAGGLPAVGGFLTAFGHALAMIRPARVGLLLPESNYRAPYSELAPRAAAEALVLIAGQQANIPVERLPRPTLRSKLNFPMAGSLDTYVNQFPLKRVGPHWNEGRWHAAAAAYAISKN
jgi:hypothetical protein